LLNTLDLAKHCDELGYNRYWLAEHHNTPLIASSAPEIMIGHVASITKRIRVGSGGVMLPNHAPLKVAEIFHMLEALHPGRIDLGIGRAPGTDPRTALALRRSREALTVDDFPEQLNELLAFLSGNFPDNHPHRKIRAIPEGVSTPELWLLGSSDFSALLAAQLGLGFAFAHHINPWPAVEVCKLYCKLFRPSIYLTEPQIMLAVSAICATTVEQAEELAISTDLTLLKLPLGKLKHFPSIAEAKDYKYDQEEQQIIRYNRARFFVGSPSTVHEQIYNLAKQSGVNEVIVTTITHEHEARRRSYKLLADAFCLSAL
jgi:luciferase family oxidoreductase group 1